MMTQKHNIQAPILEIKDLKKSFGANHVLNGFNLELFEGENVVIMGRSGSGKSVMIKCLVGLMEADSGSIRVMGKEISTLNPEDLNTLRTDIGFLFQGSALDDINKNLHRSRILLNSFWKFWKVWD